MVFSHQCPAQVLRLLRTLRERSPEAVLVSHHNRVLFVPAEVRASRVLPPTRVSWGAASQLLMMLRGMRHALRFEWDWLVLLSGQDYPLRPLPEIERELGARGVEGYVEGVPVAGDDEFARRYCYRYRRGGAPARRRPPPPFFFRERPRRGSRGRPGPRPPPARARR